jgi:hypothetical protein
MKTFDLIQATMPHTLKDPHSKALEPDCLSPSACHYDTVSKELGLHAAQALAVRAGHVPIKEITPSC